MSDIENQAPAPKGLSVRADAKTRYIYLQEEMKAARTRIDEEIRTMNQFEILSIIAIGLVYWFVVDKGIQSRFLLAIICLFPFLISAYGLFRYRAHAQIIQVMEKYIKFHIEKTIYGKTSFKGLSKYYDRKKTGNLRLARYVFWIAITFITFFILIVAAICPELMKA